MAVQLGRLEVETPDHVVLRYDLAGGGNRGDEHRARLDRIRNQPVLAIPLTHGHVRLREQQVDLALLQRPRVAPICLELSPSVKGRAS